MEEGATLAIAYLIGSIPTGYLITRILSGSDIRSIGSGGTGATNVQRVLGWRWGLAIALADVLKGAAVVLIARWLGTSDLVIAVAAAVAVAAHCWPVWLRFHGGKGVATGGGAAIALSPWALVLIPLIVVPVAMTRYVSLGSIVAATSAPLVFLLLAITGAASEESVLFGVCAAFIIIGKHRSNIQRLRARTERRLGSHEGSATTA